MGAGKPEGGYVPGVITIPGWLREYRQPWMEGVDPEVQRHIRFGGNICTESEELKENRILYEKAFMNETGVGIEGIEDMKALEAASAKGTNPAWLAQSYFLRAIPMNAPLAVIENIVNPMLESKNPALRRSAEDAKDRTLSGKRIADPVSGGANTMMWSRERTEVWGGVKDIIAQQYFPREYDDRDARNLLSDFLGNQGVALIIEGGVQDGAYKMAYEICQMLPRSHFGHNHYRFLKLGGGGGAAKCSQHTEGPGSKVPDMVHIYDFALDGPKRNFACLLLHETGHAHFDQMVEKGLEKQLHEAFTMVRHEEGFKDVFIDYLYGPESRFQSAGAFNEFMAEMYPLYVIRGKGLMMPEKPKNRNVIQGWARLFTLFRDSFGCEYN